MPLVEEWTSGGVPWSVSTDQRPGESQGAWELRHQEAVDFWQTIAPPD